jgi:C-terminal processing protease CtpA/Prc
MVAMLTPGSAFGRSSQVVEYGALGVSMSDQPSDNPAGGVMIEYIYPGSPAAQIGLLPRDRILSIANHRVVDYRDVIRLVSANAPYAQIELGVARGNWRGTMTATLGPARKVLRAAPPEVQTKHRLNPPHKFMRPQNYKSWNRRDAGGGDYAAPNFHAQ